MRSSLRHTTLRITTASSLAVMGLSHSAFAQAALGDRSTGPTMGGFIKDMSSWGANHPGAAIALSVAFVMAIGMIIYNRFKGKAP